MKFPSEQKVRCELLYVISLITKCNHEILTLINFETLFNIVVERYIFATFRG